MRKSEKWISEILHGIVLVCVMTAMIVSGTINLDKFYDMGAVEEIALAGRHTIEITAYTQSWEYSIKGDAEQMEWIKISLSNLSVPEIAMQIILTDAERVPLYSEEYILKEGETWIATGGIDYKYIQYYVAEQSGISFKFDEVSARGRRIEQPSFVIVCLLEVVLLMLYMAVRKCLGYLFEQSSRNVLDEVLLLLQSLFIRVGGVGKTIYERIGSIWMARLRVGIICLIFVYMQVASIFSLYVNQQYFRYHMLFCATMLIMLALLYWERPLKALVWNRRVAKYWMMLWVVAAISEFIVPKRFAFQSFMMVFVMGFVYFMIDNRVSPADILRDLRSALKVWLWINMPFCILLYPYEAGIRYQGISKNANIWAMYLVFVLTAFLSSLYEHSVQKRCYKRGIIDVMSAAFAIDMIVKTGSSCGLIPSVICVFFFLAILLKSLWHQRDKRKNILLLFGGSVLFVGTIYLSDWLLSQHFFVANVQAASLDIIKNNRVVNKLLNSGGLDDFTSGRTYYWKAYLREMNLWGHEFSAKLWGKNVSAHNGVLAITHRYGVLSTVPYLMILLLYVQELWLERKKRMRDDACYMMHVMFAVSALLLISVENLEFPFYYISWYCFYLPLGIFLGKRVDDGM